MPTIERPLGRIVQHDERSRTFRATLAGGPLVSTHWKRYGPVFDQGDLGSCTGNAIAGAMNTAPFRRWYTRYKTESDAVKAYGMATRLDDAPGEYPPDDTGSSGLAVCKAAVQLGWIKAYHHAFGLEEALRALMISPVIAGTNWYGGMFTPKFGGLVEIKGSLAGGHEYELIGFDLDLKLVEGVNSWGPGWADKGHFYMSFATFERLLHEEGDVTVPVR